MDHATEDLTGVWSDFNRTRSKQLRDRLIIHYLPLVKEIAGTVATHLVSHVDRDDLESYATFGLIEAVDRYDPTLGSKFEAYAAPRIRGQIFDELRIVDPVPRTVRSRAKAADRATSELSNTLGRHPTPAEIADRLGCSIEDLDRVTRDRDQARIRSLDEPVKQSTDTWGSRSSTSIADTISDLTVDVETDWDLNQKRERIANAVAALEERERVILSLYYLQGLSWDRIAEALGVVKSTIVRLHDQAINRVRDHIRASA